MVENRQIEGSLVFKLEACPHMLTRVSKIDELLAELGRFLGEQSRTAWTVGYEAGQIVLTYATEVSPTSASFKGGNPGPAEGKTHYLRYGYEGMISVWQDAPDTSSVATRLTYAYSLLCQLAILGCRVALSYHNPSIGGRTLTVRNTEPLLHQYEFTVDKPKRIPTQDTPFQNTPSPRNNLMGYMDSQGNTYP